MPTEGDTPAGDSEKGDVPQPRMMMAASKTRAGPTAQDLPWKAWLTFWFTSTCSRYLLLSLFCLVHATVFLHGFFYYTTDEFITARSAFGPTFPTATAAGLVLHLDLVILMFPACRSLVSLLRRTPLDRVMDIDSKTSLHKLTAWSMVYFASIHIIAHICNFAYLAAKESQGLKGFLLLNFATEPGWSGYLMLALLMLMAVTSLEAFRRVDFKRFWFTHHLFLAFFVLWSIHGTFCMVKADIPSACAELGAFWQYWVYGGVFYLIDGILREWRGRHQSFVSKVIQHPSNVLEIQIKKGKTIVKAGQYVYLSCPEVAICQDRPFALTSAPEENYLSVHIHCTDDYTRTLAEALGCHYEQQKDRRAPYTSTVIGIDHEAAILDVDPTIRRLLPSVFIDGPFGGTPKDLSQFEVVVLIALGDRVELFASILKSIWYRMNYPGQKCCIRKVYFLWACNDFIPCEWFASLLMATEAQDMDHNIEIYTYLISTTISKDTITGFRVPTKLGVPNWGAVLTLSHEVHGPRKTCSVASGLDRMGLECTVI